MSAPIIFRDNSTCVILWVWIDEDPTAATWVENPPEGTPLVRTDTAQLYRKSGGDPQDWILMGGGGSGTGVDVQQDAIPVVTPASTLNYTGNGVMVTDSGGGVAEVAIPGVAVQQDGTPVLAPTTTLNFFGDVAVTDFGGGQADVEIGIVMQVGRYEGGTSEPDEGDTSEPVEIDPTDDTAYVVNNNEEHEDPQVFTLPNGAEDGHNITIIVQSTTNNEVQVEVANLDPGENGDTFTIMAGVPGNPASAILSWNAELGYWQVAALRGFTVS